jgi:hypothetical protein
VLKNRSRIISCFGPFKEEGDENVKEEPELVVPDAAAAGPLINRAQEEAALQSVLGQLHAAQRERMLVMEREEREKVAYIVLNNVTGSGGLAYGCGSESLLLALDRIFRPVRCKKSSAEKNKFDHPLIFTF